MSIDDELVLSKRLQISRCGRLTKEQLGLDNQQEIVEEKHYHVFCSTNLKVIKMIGSFNLHVALSLSASSQAFRNAMGTN